MADVTTGAVWAAVTGAASAALAELGLPPGVLAAGAFGAVLGSPAAPAVSRTWQIGIFVSVAFGASIFAMFFASPTKSAQMGWAIGLGALAHPLLAAAAGILPQVLAAFARVPAKPEGGKDGNP